MRNFNKFGIKIPGILLPKEKKLDSWSVIACDQYTQDMDYWNKVSEAAGTNPSTLNLILPEVYLGAPDRKERLEKTYLRCYFALFALQRQSTFITLQSPFLVSTSILISKSLRLTS